MLTTSDRGPVRTTLYKRGGIETGKPGSLSVLSLLQAGRSSSPATSIARRFGRRLRFLRNERGMTQASLALRLGIDRSYISDVECGRKTMTLSYLETVAQGFNMPLADLVDGL